MKNLLILVILFINVKCISQNNNKRNNNINVSIAGNHRENLLNGLVSSILTISNNTSQDINILLFYPNPNDLSFESKSSLVKMKDRQWNDNERSVPIKISSGKSYQITYFLNRYFTFLAEGNIKINYTLELLTSTEGNPPKSNSYKGEFDITVINDSKEGVAKQTSYYQSNLKSDDRKIKMESEEALFYLNEVSKK
ncbi:hypothetical protein CLU96_3684 [Chryseobacterium sp. 52]|uniref:hypothetical protein n=1 Tax=Chryseobacterium sp. 52 TaxID=2035213 RepID=UPI000C1825B2|nr:hypothetical protein [Chryseobacterium sp. 52]PIF46646.1 hypothetical protein CLU96_3684 [Chryseobacterium sp. 52]